MRETRFYTSMLNYLYDLIQWTFHCYSQWYSDGTQKQIFNWGFLYKAIFHVGKAETKYDEMMIRCHLREIIPLFLRPTK